MGVTTAELMDIRRVVKKGDSIETLAIIVPCKKEDHNWKFFVFDLSQCKAFMYTDKEYRKDYSTLEFESIKKNFLHRWFTLDYMEEKGIQRSSMNSIRDSVTQ